MPDLETEYGTADHHKQGTNKLTSLDKMQRDFDHLLKGDSLKVGFQICGTARLERES